MDSRNVTTPKLKRKGLHAERHLTKLKLKNERRETSLTDTSIHIRKVFHVSHDLWRKSVFAFQAQK